MTAKTLSKILLTDGTGQVAADISLPEPEKSTDQVIGVVKLSDSLSGSEDAATGNTAATPKAVKTIDSKIGDLTQLDTDEKSNIVNSINDLKHKLDTSGGAGGTRYVLAPKITSPSADAVGQNVKPLISGTGFTSLVPGDARKHRIFEVSKSKDFNSLVINAQENADSYTVVTALDPNTKYYVRIKDVAVKGGASDYSLTVAFTTGAAVGPLTPSLSVYGFNNSPTDIGSGVRITATPYTISNGSPDTHRATSWSVKKTGDITNVWELKDSTSYLTEVRVPDGTLEPGTQYTAECIYHSTTYPDAAPAQITFTTSLDFGKVNTPDIIVEGYPNKVPTLPRISGSPFTSTRIADKHIDTEVKITKSSTQTAVLDKTYGSNVTRIHLAGPLESNTQYEIRLRYKGEKLGWSEWADLTLITTDTAQSGEYNYVGVPGTLDFGIGLARPEAYESFSLGVGTEDEKKGHPLPDTANHGTFQYGLYEWGNPEKDPRSARRNTPVDNSVAVYMNWYPKFYWTTLFDPGSGLLISEDRLRTEILPYVEVSLDQLKEAQRRSPNNCMVIAPAKSFTDEADANAHGFYMPAAFIDGGKEQDGFFCTNTNSIAIYSDADDVRILIHGWKSNDNSILPRFKGMTVTCARLYDSAASGGAYVGPNKFSIKPMGDTANFGQMSCAIKGALTLLSLCQGQYATSTLACAWYDSTLQTNYPKGINNSGNRDTEDASVKVSVGWNSTAGQVFADNYSKTTVTGSMAGATHVNGPLYVPLIGMATTLGSSIGSRTLKSSVSLRDLTPANITQTEHWENNPALWYTHNSNTTGSSKYVGATGNTSLMFGAAINRLTNILAGVLPPVSGTSGGGTSEFGVDQLVNYGPSSTYPYETPLAFGYYSGNTSAGMWYFCGSGNGGLWSGSSDAHGLRGVSYPVA